MELSGNMSQMMAQLQTIVTKAMADELASGSENVMKNHVNSDVYVPYEGQYTRTFELLDDCEATMIDSNTLELKNTRHDGDRYIPEILEYGKGYYNEELDSLIGARPFIENTYNELKDGKARELLKQGLEKRLGIGNVL